MTFSTKLKEEICTNDINSVAMFSELSAILRYDSKIMDNKLVLISENAAVARRIFKDIKACFNISPHIIVRNQKRLRAKQIYILEITSRFNDILTQLNIKKDNHLVPMNRDYLEDPEEMIAYVRGTFLACGSINDPSKSGYHLEYVFTTKRDADFMNSLLHEMKFDSKTIERHNRVMVYLKNSEEISDMIRMFGAANTLFQFEDVRIYRDHKNMVNRLNNCDIANQEKSMETGSEQLKIIAYLKEHDLVDLLDEHTQIVLDYRCKYPESSYQELASIITMETGYKIGKSGVNHHFIKMKQLMQANNHSKS